MTTILDLLKIWKRDMICTLVVHGEWDETCHIGWVDGLNGVCNICGCTDVLGVYVCKDTAGNDAISILLQDEDDVNCAFVGLEELPLTIADEVYRKIMCYYGGQSKA